MAGKEAHASRRPKRLVVVGVARSKGSDAALVWAAREACTRGAPLKVVYVSRSPVAHGVHHQSPAESAALDAAFSRTLAAKVSSVLGPELGVQILQDVQHGRAAKALLAEASGADLLVAGRRSGHFPKVLRSVGSRVAHHASFPVTVVPPAH